MRILFVTPAFPPFPGGGERYARSLALQLARHGNRITVLTSTALAEGDFWHPVGPQRGRKEELDENLHVVRCPVTGFPGGRSGLLAWRKAMVLLSTLPGDQSAWLMRMARRVPAVNGFEATLHQLGDACDLIHGFNLSWEYPVLAGWRWAQDSGKPIVVTPFLHFGSRPGDRVARNTTMDHQRRILLAADAVLSLTSIERDGIINLGADPSRVSVVGAGLDPLPAADETSGDRAVAEHYHLRPPIAAFVGRLSHDKGAIHAAEAVRELNRSGTGLTLALVGQTTTEFDRYYRRLEAADREHIRPVGLLNEIEKHDLIRASEMLLLPSRTDSFGIVLLEAWAHGKPVIGARAGGIPEVISDGENGLLIDWGDVPGLVRAARRLLHDRPLGHALGQRGKIELAARYSWDQVSDRILRVYDQVLR